MGLGTWASSVNTMTSDGEIEIRWFGHDPDKWDELRRRYQKELKDNNDLIKLLERNHGR